MRRQWLALLLAAAAACGPEAAEPGPRIDFDLVVSRATSDLISAFQVAVVPKGRSAVPDCAAAQKKCLVDQLTADQLAPISGADGKPHPAVVFPVALRAGTPSTQDVSVGGIPPGKDFAVVIEALSKTNPPALVGSSCNYVQEISSGKNALLLAATITQAPVACDPRYEK